MALRSESTLSDLTGKKIGLTTGSIFSITLPPILPDSIFLEFNAYSDVISALENGKIDTFPTDESIYKAMLWEGSAVTRMEESIDVSNYGMIFTKGENPELQREINEYLEQSRADGTHHALEEKWFGDSEPTEF
ncbi:MAG: transporter substrate-binding domain-containing protein, partial [Clostridia bacterium]|nr:transporter substrate-binding domain-containing protein [Clostridia bacterium]